MNGPGKGRIGAFSHQAKSMAIGNAILLFIVVGLKGHFKDERLSATSQNKSPGGLIYRLGLLSHEATG